jgi:ABC-type nitrate/sulfonate/bicarbonate transport system substrate-binding protein
VPVEIFTVDEYGAPPYPELVLTVSRKTLEEKPELVEAVQRATVRGYEFTMEHSSKALGDLLAAVPALDPVEQGGQLTVLMHSGLQPAPFDPRVLHEWAAWDFKYGLLSRPLSREEFDQSFVDENLRPLGQ